MQGVYFGPRQVGPGIIEHDYDDECEYQRGTLRRVLCTHKSTIVKRSALPRDLGTCPECGSNMGSYPAVAFYSPGGELVYSIDKVLIECEAASGSLYVIDPFIGPIERRLERLLLGR